MLNGPATVDSKIYLALTLIGLSVALVGGCIVQSGDQSPPAFEGTVESLGTAFADQATQISAQATMISHLATRGPAVAPSAPQIPPTPYYPVMGSIVIEEGRCCAGGITGEPVELRVQFEASSPFGEVTHMRVRAGSGPLRAEQLQSSSAWEPFVKERTFSAPVAINWTGFYVNVQYRDSAFNLSPVVWDDISIEGQPAPTP